MKNGYIGDLTVDMDQGGNIMKQTCDHCKKKSTYSMDAIIIGGEDVRIKVCDEHVALGQIRQKHALESAAFKERMENYRKKWATQEQLIMIQLFP